MVITVSQKHIRYSGCGGGVGVGGGGGGGGGGGRGGWLYTAVTRKKPPRYPGTHSDKVLLGENIVTYVNYSHGNLQCV